MDCSRKIALAAALAALMLAGCGAGGGGSTETIGSGDGTLTQTIPVGDATGGQDTAPAPVETDAQPAPPATADHEDPATVNPDAMVIVETTGGLCEYGGCWSWIAFERDGTFTTQEGRVQREGDITYGANEGLGTIPGDLASDLRAEVDHATEDELTSGPFEGTCPTAYDGIERRVIVRPDGRDEIDISSCSQAFDTSAPLFGLIERATTAAAGGDEPGSGGDAPGGGGVQDPPIPTPDG